MKGENDQKPSDKDADEPQPRFVNDSDRETFELDAYGISNLPRSADKGRGLECKIRTLHRDHIGIRTISVLTCALLGGVHKDGFLRWLAKHGHETLFYVGANTTTVEPLTTLSLMRRDTESTRTCKHPVSLCRLL